MNTTQPNPYSLPSDVEQAYREVDQQFMTWLQTGQLDKAKDSWERVYDKFLEKQEQLGYRLHKGGPLHNLGISTLFSNEIETAFKYFVLGYSEDVASQEQRFLKVPAEEAPGAKTLKMSFGVGDELFGLVRKRVIDELGKNGFRDPKRAFSNFLASQLGDEKVKKGIEALEEDPLTVEKKFEISDIPGVFEERVFVGGNYNYPEVLRQIKSIVNKNRRTPIFVGDFDEESDLTPRRKSLILLHNCKYAIFDVTNLSGQLIEIERAVDYEINTRLVYQTPNDPKFKLTEMIKGLHEDPKEFSNIQELERLIQDHIKV